MRKDTPLKKLDHEVKIRFLEERIPKIEEQSIFRDGQLQRGVKDLAERITKLEEAKLDELMSDDEPLLRRIEALERNYSVKRFNDREAGYAEGFREGVKAGIKSCREALAEKEMGNE